MEIQIAFYKDALRLGRRLMTRRTAAMGSKPMTAAISAILAAG